MTEDGPIEQMLEAYVAAVRAKDVDAFVALYDEDVRVFDLWDRWSYDGAEAWRATVAEWFGSLGADRVEVELQDVRTIVGDGAAAAHAFVTFRGRSAEGEELRAMSNRLTWALRRTVDGAWKVVHEHTSAPVDAASAKVALER